MQNNLFLLTKVNMLASLDMRGSKANKAKSMSLMAYLGLVIAMLVLLGGVMSFFYGKLLVDNGSNYVYATIYIAAILTMMMLTTTITAVKGTFAGKDYDMLKSMPIKRSTVIASKLIGIYLVELVYSTALLLPNAIIGIILTKDVMQFVMPFIMIFLTPALPIAVGALISLFISMFSDRFKFANIISMILYAGIFVAIFIMSYMSRSSSGNAATIEDSIKVFMWFNPTLFFLAKAFLDNMIWALVFIGVNLLTLIVIFTVLALAYDYVHSLIISNKADIKYERKALKNKGEFKALFSLEMKKLTGNKIFFINAIMAGLSSVMGCMICGFSINGVTFNPEQAQYIKNYAYIGSLIIMFCAGISVPTSFTISMEGKNFWMIKAYPIDVKKLMKAKLLVSLIFTLPTAILSCVILCIFAKASIFSIIMMILSVLAYMLLVNFLGLRMNLAFPKLKWTNENEIVKNSASLVACMFIDWGIVMVTAGVMVGLMFVNMYVAPIVATVALAIMAFCFYMAIMKRCERIIDSYENF